MLVSTQPLKSSGDSFIIPPSDKPTDHIGVAASPTILDSSSEACSYPREATADDVARLRHVADKVPPIVWLVAFIGAAQRFAYYGTTVPWRKADLVCDGFVEHGV